MSWISLQFCDFSKANARCLWTQSLWIQFELKKSHATLPLKILSELHLHGKTPLLAISSFFSVTSAIAAVISVTAADNSVVFITCRNIQLLPIAGILKGRPYLCFFNQHNLFDSSTKSFLKGRSHEICCTQFFHQSAHFSSIRNVLRRGLNFFQIYTYSRPYTVVVCNLWTFQIDCSQIEISTNFLIQRKFRIFAE